MSGQYARLKNALNRAEMTTPGPVQVAVFADDLHEILAHYIKVSTELAELKANDTALLHHCLGMIEGEWPKGDDAAAPLLDKLRQRLGVPQKPAGEWVAVSDYASARPLRESVEQGLVSVHTVGRVKP